ncbi:MAG: CPBP family intramembrane metalloprotease [Lachnospiraceae bacterium]|nr:CPBP family intramembrane metalloprotease [Lachnospiraceae bacterium]
MVKLSNQERLKPWMGVILFVIGLAFLAVIGSIMQTFLGLAGLVLTELGFLGISILFCVIRKVSIKEVFPISKVTGRGILGVLFMTAGAFLLNLLALGISMLFAPNVEESITGLSNFLYGSKTVYALILLIVAIMPAVCEEAFMRGAVLSCFRSLNRDWVICLIIGVMFGILHLDPLRFLNTACLGAVLAFVMVKTNNFIYPMMIHFINNFISSAAGFFTMSATENSQEAIETAVSAIDLSNKQLILGQYMLYGFAAPILLVLGAMFLDRKSHRPRRFLIAGIISAVLFIGGLGLTVSSTAGTLLNGGLLNWNSSYEVTEEAIQGKNLAEAGIDIEEEKAHMVTATATTGGAEVKFVIYDENGNEIASKTASGMMIFSETISFKPGHYTLAFEGGEDLVGKTFEYQVLVY